MKTIPIRALVLLVAMFGLRLMSAQAQVRHCSTAGTAGRWAYPYSGTIYTPAGPLPVASVGHFLQDANGNITGQQTRSVAGSSGEEDISGTLTVDKSCNGTATIKVFVNGQLQRTAVLAVAFDQNMNHARGIFASLMLPDGTNVPVVITTDNSKVFPSN